MSKVISTAEPYIEPLANQLQSSKVTPKHNFAQNKSERLLPRKTQEEVLFDNVLHLIDRLEDDTTTKYTANQIKLMKELTNFIETVDSILNDPKLDELQKDTINNLLSVTFTTLLCEMAGNQSISKYIDYTKLFGSFVDFKKLLTSMVDKIGVDNPQLDTTKLQQHVAEL